MDANALSKVILDAAFKVHNSLGPGLLESVYEAALAIELAKAGHIVERQVPFPAVYEGLTLEHGFRADLVVDRLVLIEIKSVEIVPRVAYKVVLTYLRMSGMKLGLLLNFGEEYLKDGIRRIANDMPSS